MITQDIDGILRRARSLLKKATAEEAGFNKEVEKLIADIDEVIPRWWQSWELYEQLKTCLEKKFSEVGKVNAKVNVSDMIDDKRWKLMLPRTTPVEEIAESIWECYDLFYKDDVVVDIGMIVFGDTIYYKVKVKTA